MKVLEKLSKFKKQLVEEDINLFSLKMGRIGNFFKKVWRGIKKGASWVHKKILKPIGNVARKIVGKAGGAIGTTVGGLLGGPAGAAAGGALGGVAQKIAN